MKLALLAVVGFLTWIALPAAADENDPPGQNSDDGCIPPAYTNNNFPIVHLHRDCFCPFPIEDCTGIPSWVWQ